jgi:hypothetical protein
VTCALALIAVFTMQTAVTVWFPSKAGAVYSPEALIVPVVELPPATESTDHVTAVLVVPVTVAVNCLVEPTGMLTVDAFSVIDS